MSISVHLEALRPSLSSHFKNVTFCVSDARKIKTLYDELTEASHMLLYELVADWSATHSPVLRLPDEVLALCFSLLPFRARVSASHVSRRWRSVCLSHPAIWAHIDSDASIRHKFKLLEMALDRTGEYPVDLLDCADDDADKVDDLLAGHIHHIRTLHYPVQPYMAPLSYPAPLLETFVCNTSHTVHLEPDFLSGAVGRLRKLHIDVVTFPVTCPALSTVVDLSLCGPYNVHHAKHFYLLFQLFPALQSLTFLGLKRKFAEMLPTGPAPASLRHLNLHSGDMNYDLTALCATWCPTPNALDRLEVSHIAVLSDSLVDFVDGAGTLDVQYDAHNEMSVLAATGPGSRYRRLRYWEERADQRVLAARLVDLGSALQNVSMLSLPATSLSPFLDVFALLPELVRLTITIGRHDVDYEPHEYPWDALAPLARLEHRGKLDSLVLHVSVCAHPECASPAQDAKELLAQLSLLGHARFPDITVTGFPPAVLRDVPQATFSGFRVVFASADEPAVAQAGGTSH